MSKTAVESSGEVNVTVASHLSNFPVMAVDASTSNFIVLSTGVISKTGTCARVADGNMASIKTRRIANLIEASLEDKQHGRLSSQNRGVGRAAEIQKQVSLMVSQPLPSVERMGDVGLGSS